MTEEIEHLEIELEWYRQKFDGFFTTDGEIAPNVKWIDLFGTSVSIMKFEDEIHKLKNS